MAHEQLSRRFAPRAIAKVVRSWLPSGSWMDAVYSWLRYVAGQHRLPRYRKPKLLNDHLFRLRNDGSLLLPLRQFITDKEYVKHYVASVVGWEYTLQTYAVLRTSGDVDRLELSRFPCVVKPSHMSGEVILVHTHRQNVDTRVLKRWLSTDYYRVSREPNYRYLEPKILVEEFFLEPGMAVPRDFKFHCFHGIPRIVQVDSGRFGNHTRNFYDPSWHRLTLDWVYPPGAELAPKPSCLPLMLRVAEKLARSLAYIRVDMYTDGATVKVGEMTSCPDGAKRVLRPRSAEVWLGNLFAGTGRS